MSKLICLVMQQKLIDADKFKTVPVDLSKLSNTVNNDAVKNLCMIN